MSGRVSVLRKLIKDKNVSEIINACDAGREGELIFRYITQYARTKKPIKRLWLQSMTPEAIRDGFARLRSDAEMQPLASAAAQPKRGGLARRYQRHARIYFAPQWRPREHCDFTWPRPDADAGHHRGAGKQN